MDVKKQLKLLLQCQHITGAEHDDSEQHTQNARSCQQNYHQEVQHGSLGEDGIRADEKPAVIPLLSRSRRSRFQNHERTRAA